MSAKLKNTIIILVIIILIAAGGGVYSFVFQRSKINEKQKKIKDLKMFQLDTKSLTEQLDGLKKRVAQLDSILAMRKYTVPVKLSQAAFFEFVNKISYSFSPDSYVNIEYNDLVNTSHFMIYKYNISGTAEFNDLNKLIYGIEESKQLKKITSTDLTNFVKVDEDGTPHYLVTYKLTVEVYFTSEDRFSVRDFKENSLEPNPLYDVFYPLIRNEIPPNKDNLLDVQSAKLLALIPDGAFISDSKGSTYLLWEGDKVYLGYLTEIDYENNEVRFILNKGGIIEKVTLTLEKEQVKEKSKPGK